MTMNLCSLHSHLLGQLWPPERVVVGMRVSKATRSVLQTCSPTLSVKIGQGAPPDVRFNILGGIETSFEPVAEDVRHALKRFEAASQLHLQVEACNREAFPALTGLSKAQDDGWRANLVSLDLCSTRQSPSKVFQALEGILRPTVLGRHTSLRSLDLSKNRVEDLCQSLASSIVGFTSLTFLNLSNCQIGGSGFILLSPTLQQCRGLTHLNLAANHLDRTGIEQIGGVLRHCPLRDLNLQHCLIGFNEVAILCQDLPCATSLTRLDMSHNYVACESSGMLARAISDCTRLTRLDLHKNSIGCDGISALSLALQQSTALTILDLHSNRARSSSASHLLIQMCAHGRVTDLNLGWNETGLSNRHFGSDTRQLASALAHCSSLTKLHLCRNWLGPPGVQPICMALGGARNLGHLHLAFNDIKEEGARAVAASLPECKALVHLDLRGNKFGDAGVKALAASLSQCPSLRDLDLACNEVGRVGATEMAAVLHDCQAMRRLDMRENTIDAVGGHRLQLLRGGVEVLVDEPPLHGPSGWLPWTLARPVLSRFRLGCVAQASS